MKNKRPLIISTLAAFAVVAGLSLTAVSVDFSRPGWAAQAAAERDGRHGFGGRHHGAPGRHFGRLCGERRDARLDDMIVFVESFANFTAEQAAAWNGLTAALRSGSDTIGAACDDLAAAGRPATAADKLARVEQMMEAGLVALRQVRPAFEDFYAVLDDEQKKAIDALASHHGRRH